MRCFDCGRDGHIAANCDVTAADTSGKPPWCGICAETTRLLGRDEAHRCPVCHPLRHHQLKQYRKCPECHVTVYAWDTGPCGKHDGPSMAQALPERGSQP